VVAAAASYGLATVVARQKAHGPSLPLASGQIIFAALIAVPLALSVDGAPALDISARAALAWVALGALSTGLAYVIFFSLVQRMSATQISVTTYIIPIIAAVLGWLVLDESIGPNPDRPVLVVGVAAVNGYVRWTWDRIRGTTEGAGAGAPGG
jgi:drug/metabolite transporter (DMT)-like permease